MTSKGQTTIPQEIREALGLDRGDLLLFLSEGDRALLIPLHRRPLGELMGALPPSRPSPGMAEIRQDVRQELGRRIVEGEE